MAFRWMCLDWGELTFNYGKGIYCCPATSGRPGIMDSKIEDAGPIPPGNYYFNPYDIDYVAGAHYSARNFVYGDWGHYRARLFPYDASQTSRSGFYVHGGKIPGSAGCIDVDGYEKELFELIKATNSNDGTDNVLIVVTEHPNKPGWENESENPITVLAVKLDAIREGFGEAIEGDD